TLCRLALRGLRLKNTSNLSTRLGEHPSDLRRRRLNEADKLRPEFIERGQISERFHPGSIEHGLAHRAAEDHELLVLLRVRDGCLCRRNGICRVGDRSEERRVGKEGRARW